MKLLKSPGISGEGTRIFHNSLIKITNVFTVQEIIKPEIVQQHCNSRPRPLTALLVVQVLPCTIMHITHHITHPHNLAQSPASHQHSQSTIHVQTWTLRINAPHFQPNLHQPSPPQLAQNNQSTNYHTNQQQVHTLPTQPFNTHLPQSFNPQVPPPYFPQYPPTNSPSASSTDSSILLALQKQWERQEKLDMECNEMERQKEERKRIKEERNKGRRNENEWKNAKTNKEAELTKLLRNS